MLPQWQPPFPKPTSRRLTRRPRFLSGSHSNRAAPFSKYTLDPQILLPSAKAGDGAASRPGRRRPPAGTGTADRAWTARRPAALAGVGEKVVVQTRQRRQHRRGHGSPARPTPDDETRKARHREDRSLPSRKTPWCRSVSPSVLRSGANRASGHARASDGPRHGRPEASGHRSAPQPDSRDGGSCAARGEGRAAAAGQLRSAAGLRPGRSGRRQVRRPRPARAEPGTGTSSFPPPPATTPEPRVRRVLRPSRGSRARLSAAGGEPAPPEGRPDANAARPQAGAGLSAPAPPDARRKALLPARPPAARSVPLQQDTQPAAGRRPDAPKPSRGLPPRRVQKRRPPAAGRSAKPRRREVPTDWPRPARRGPGPATARPAAAASTPRPQTPGSPSPSGARVGSSRPRGGRERPDTPGAAGAPLPGPSDRVPSPPGRPSSRGPGRRAGRGLRSAGRTAARPGPAPDPGPRPPAAPPPRPGAARPPPGPPRTRARPRRPPRGPRRRGPARRPAPSGPHSARRVLREDGGP